MWKIPTPLIFIIILVITVTFFSGCRHPDDIRVTFVNNTNYVLHLRMKGELFSPDKPLHPGKSIRSAGNLRSWPARIQAFDQDGIVRFDKTISREELQEMDFRIVIE